MGRLQGKWDLSLTVDCCSWAFRGPSHVHGSMLYHACASQRVEMVWDVPQVAADAGGHLPAAAAQLSLPGGGLPLRRQAPAHRRGPCPPRTPLPGARPCPPLSCPFSGSPQDSCHCLAAEAPSLALVRMPHSAFNAMCRQLRRSQMTAKCGLT